MFVPSAIVVSLLVCIILCSPLIRHRGKIFEREELHIEDERAKEERLDVLLSDLELDFHTGKISQEDYQRTKNALTKQRSI